MTKRVCLVAGLILVCVPAAVSPIMLAQVRDTSNAKGIIRGIVVDEDGSPVAEAEVRPYPRVGASKRWAWTGKDGRFEMDHLPLGDYMITASKESEGYPEQGAKLYNNGAQFQAVLTDAYPAEEVRIILGPKAGILTLMVTDGVSGQPIAAGFNMWEWTDPNNKMWGHMNPLLVPSDRRVGLEINAEGYQPWRYPGSDQSAPLAMKPGETRTLNIKLRPEVK